MKPLLIKPFEDKEKMQLFLLLVASKLGDDTVAGLCEYAGRDFCLILSLLEGKKIRFPAMSSLYKYRDMVRVFFSQEELTRSMAGKSECDRARIEKRAASKLGLSVAQYRSYHKKIKLFVEVLNDKRERDARRDGSG